MGTLKSTALERNSVWQTTREAAGGLSRTGDAEEPIEAPLSSKSASEPWLAEIRCTTGPDTAHVTRDTRS